MATTSVFWFSKLKAGVDPAAYERWVQHTDYRLAQAIECVVHYRVHKLVGVVEGQGAPPYDYIEVLQVSDLESYRSAMQHDPALQQIIAEIGQFVEGLGGAWGTVIAPPGKEA
jgi:REDY-like protein HapK